MPFVVKYSKLKKQGVIIISKHYGFKFIIMDLLQLQQQNFKRLDIMHNFNLKI